MPAFPGTSAGARRDRVEQGEDIALAILREGAELLGDVYRPSKDDFLHAPGGVAFAELFEEDWFLPRSVVLVVRSEEIVDGVKDMLHHLPSFNWPSLNYTDEVI